MSETDLVAGTPTITPLNGRNSHKDSLSRLSDAIHVFRKEVKDKKDFKSVLHEVFRQSKSMQPLKEQKDDPSVVSNSLGSLLWKEKIGSAKNILFKLDPAKFTANTWKNILEMFKIKEEGYTIRDNLDVNEWKRMSRSKKLEQKCSILNIWQVEKLTHPYMPFVMKDRQPRRLNPDEQNNPKGFWYRLDFRGGNSSTSK